VRAPYQPLQEWLEGIVDVCDPEALRRLLQAEGGELLARLAPGLAPLVEPRVRGSGEPNEERDLLQAAAVDLLTAISKNVPLVVIADDIHWADVETLHLLRRLARVAPGSRMVLLAAVRDHGEERSHDLDELIADFSRLEWVRRVSLGRLSSADVHALIRSSTSADASDGLVTAVGDLTDGTPLLVCELWRDLVETGAVTVSDGRADLVVPLVDVRGPEQVRDIVRQRIGRLGIRTVAMLELAAVAAANVDLRVLAKGAGLNREMLVAAVGEAAGTGIVEELPGSRPCIRFAHELVRRALYDRLSRIRRAELHGRFGTALEEVHASDLTPVIADLAHHFTEAVPILGTERAVGYNLRAAEAAVAAVAFDDATARLETALDLGVPEERLESVRVKLAFLLRDTGRAREADAVLTTGGQSPDERAQRREAAHMALFRVGRHLGDPEADPAEMRAVAEEALGTFTALGDEHGLAHANRGLALALRRGGRLAESVEAAERALKHAQASDDPAQPRRQIGTLCYALFDGPTPVRDALARCEELLTEARGDRLFEAVVTWGIAAQFAMAGRTDEAREAIAGSLPVLDATGRMLDFRVYKTLVGETLELAGDLAGAEAQLRSKWLLFRDLGTWDPDARGIQAAHQLAHLYCDQDRWDEAEHCLDYGRDVPIHDSFLHESVLRLAVKARVEAHHGRIAEATALARRATSMADRSDFLNLRARTWLAASEVEDRAGRTADASAARTTAAGHYDAKGNIAALAAMEAAP
jgi:tetratricopeptide (TPR) repeat protein